MDLHNKILENTFEHNADFKVLNCFSSRLVQKRKYPVIALPYDQDSVIEFASIYKSKDLFNTSETYCVENNVEIEIFYLVSLKKIKFKICQDMRRIPDDNQIPRKESIHRGINETIRRIRENIVGKL